MRRSLLSACLGTSVSAIAIATAGAQETKTIGTLDAVTVYATKTPASTFDVPAMVTRVDADAPGNATAGTTSDLLQFVPGVDVDNGPRRNGQTLTVRGYDDEAVITLIDGRRQNYEAEHDGRFFIDPALLKSVEIVRGPSSAIYGGGGVGGVVAFETKDAKDMLKPGQSTGALTSFGYRSANGEFAPLVSAYGRSGGLDIIGSINYRKSDDIRLGDQEGQSGPTLLTKDRVVSGIFKAGYTFADFHTVKFQYDRHQNDSSEPNNGGGTITSSNPVVEKEVRDDQFGLKYAYDNPANGWLAPKLHLYHNRTGVEEKDISGSNAGRIQSRDIETTGFTVDNTSRVTGWGGVDQALTYGFEIYTDEQEGKSSSTGTRSGVPNAEARTYGLYLQDEISLKTSVGKWTVTPAARFDSYESDDVTGKSQDESKLSPKLALSYKPTEDVVLFGSWAQAFRAPNMTELYPSGQHFPGNNFISNADLKPESVRTIELGAGYRTGGLLAKDDMFRVKAAMYRSTGDNFISQVITGTTTQYVNIPNALLMGYELEGEYRLDPVTFKFGLSEVFATNDDTDKFLSNNTPMTFVADLGYRVDPLASIVGWRSRVAARSDRPSSGATKTAGYAVHDIYLRWAPSEEYLKDMSLDLGVENVFDTSYSTRYASLREEGRSYVAKVSMKW